MGKKTDLESVHLVNHSKCMLAAFQNFRQDENMLDVTLVCNNSTLKAHKLVLSACSPFFKELFADNPCPHPVIIFRGYEFSDLKAVIDFVYKGELSVPRERLMSALKIAEELHIRGLRRSEPTSEKYEKLYNQVCGKLSGRRKRKRHRHCSYDSEKEYLHVSDFDQHLVESDESLSTKEVPLSKSQPMDVESADMEGNSVNDKDTRPVVLRVGDLATSNEESNSKNMFEDEENNVISSVEHNLSDAESQKENVDSLKEEIENQTYEPDLENIASSSHLDSFTACSENADMLESASKAEQSDFQEQDIESINTTECSEEQVGCISSSCLSPKSMETHQSDETKSHDEGKRFICSKCDDVFTSRINLMKHKALGHNNNTEKRSAYECQHCTFTTQEHDCLKSHLLTHYDKVPYKCSLCSEEFSSNELYKQHLSVHEAEKISLDDISSASEQDLFSTQNRIQEKYVEFRCSICFVRFKSKLRCQLHEKTCEGGS